MTDDELERLQEIASRPFPWRKFLAICLLSAAPLVIWEFLL